MDDLNMWRYVVVMYENEAIELGRKHIEEFKYADLEQEIRTLLPEIVGQMEDLHISYASEDINTIRIKTDVGLQLAMIRHSILDRPLRLALNKNPESNSITNNSPAQELDRNWERVDKLEAKVAKLEEIVSEMHLKTNVQLNQFNPLLSSSLEPIPAAADESGLPVEVFHPSMSSSVITTATTNNAFDPAPEPEVENILDLVTPLPSAVEDFSLASTYSNPSTGSRLDANFEILEQLTPSEDPSSAESADSLFVQQPATPLSLSTLALASVSALPSLSTSVTSTFPPGINGLSPSPPKKYIIQPGTN